MTEPIKPWKERITLPAWPRITQEAMQAEIDELRAALAHGEPVARVTGYHAGRCVIEPLDHVSVFPTGMAVYTHPALKAEPCNWTLDDAYEGDTYDSACGEKWSFIDGGPVENGVRFCQGCGKAVLIKEKSE